MAFHPNGGWSRADYPRAGHPRVGCSGPSPITSRPQVSRSRRHWLSFNAHWWWRPGHYDFSRRARRGHLLRGGCRRDRGWFGSATD